MIGHFGVNLHIQSSASVSSDLKARYKSVIIIIIGAKKPVLLTNHLAASKMKCNYNQMITRKT